MEYKLTNNRIKWYEHIKDSFEYETKRKKTQEEDQGQDGSNKLGIMT
jgi:hypothetical protein